MQSRLPVWLLTVSLAVAGSQVAHVLTYRLVAPNAEQRAHLLADTGHAYMANLPLGLAVCTVVVLLALVGRAREGRAAGPAAWHFALIAPLVFSCQEHLERFLHDGSFPWDAAFQRTFLVGLVLQLPFALAAYLVARLLLSAAEAVTALLRRPANRLLPILLVRYRPVERDARGRVAGIGFAPRGPPLFCPA